MARSTAFVCVAFLLLILAGCVSPPPDIGVLVENQQRIGRALGEGWQSLWSNDFSDAESSFAEAAELDPGLAEARRGLGLALFAQGRYHDSAAAFIEAIHIAPDAPYAVPVRDFLLTQIPFDRAVRESIRDADALLASGTNSAWIAREGKLSLQDYYHYNEPDVSETSALLDELGIVTGWSLLGPFPNVSGSGFDSEFIPESADDIASSAAYSGLDNRDVEWFTPRAARHDGTVSFSEYLDDHAYTTSYAHTTFETEDAGGYWLIFDQIGAIKCWIDDELVLSDKTAQYGADVQWIRREIQEGEHGVLVKVCNEEYSSGFRLSIVPADLDLEFTSTTYREVVPDDALHGEDPLIATLAALNDTDLPNPEALFWFSYMLSVKGYGYQSLQFAERLGELIAGTESAMTDFLASICYSGLAKWNEWRNSLKRPYRADIAFAPSYRMLLAEYAARERWEKVNELVKESESGLGPWYYGALYRALHSAIETDFQKSAHDLEEFEETYPDSPELDLMLLDSVDAYQSDSDLVLLERVAEKGLPVVAAARRMNLLFDWGNYAAAGDAAQEVIELQPTSVRARYVTLASSYYTLALNPLVLSGAANDAFWLDTFPLSRSLVGLQLDVARFFFYALERAEQLETSAPSTLRSSTTDARSRLVDALERYLTLNPRAYEVRTELLELQGRATYTEYIDSREAEEAIDEFESEPGEYQDDAVIVLSEDAFLVFGDGASRSLRYEIVKVLSQSGVSDYSTYFLDYNPAYEEVELIEAYARKPDGSETNPERIRDRLSFPGLSAGDYLVVRYAVDHYLSGPLNDELWGQATFNGFYPIHQKEFRLIFPRSYDLEVRYHNEEAVEITEQSSRPISGMQEMKFTAADVNPISLEGWLPDWRDVLTWVDVSTVSDWGVIAEWYASLSDGQQRPTPILEETTRALISDSGSDEEAIRAIFDYVSRQIEYEDLSFMYSAYVPERAGDVLEDRFGDCKDQCTLLITMLQAAGVDAYIALSTPDYRGHNFYLPSTRFTHTIVIVPREEGDLILDPTTSVFTYPELPPWMIGSVYLPIRPQEFGNDVEIRRVSDPQTVGETFYLVECSPGEQATDLRVSAVYSGTQAGAVRSALLSESTSRRTFDFNAYLQRSVPGLELKSLDVRNEESVSERPLVDFIATLPGGLRQLSRDLVAVEVPWFVKPHEELLNISVSDTRDYEIDINYPDLASAARQVTVVHTPLGHEVVTIPESTRFEAGGMIVSYSYEVVNGNVICEKFVHIPAMSVSAAAIPEFERLQEQIFRKEQEQIVLRRVN